MRRTLILLVGLVALVVAAVGVPSGAATTATPTTLPIGTAPSTQPGGTPDPAATGTILMIKLPVGSVPRAEKFYGAVFGAKPGISVGSARIVTFPDGGPGLVLLKRNTKDKGRTGAFIIKVPDLDASVRLAVANGAKKQAAFAGTPNSQAARSVDLLDPWGNQVEILQIG